MVHHLVNLVVIRLQHLGNLVVIHKDVWEAFDSVPGNAIPLSLEVIISKSEYLTLMQNTWMPSLHLMSHSRLDGDGHWFLPTHAVSVSTCLCYLSNVESCVEHAARLATER